MDVTDGSERGSEEPPSSPMTGPPAQNQTTTWTGPAATAAEKRTTTGRTKEKKSESRKEIYRYDETCRFFQALAKYGKDWEKISEEVGKTRNAAQVRGYYYRVIKRVNYFLADGGYSLDTVKASDTPSCFSLFRGPTIEEIDPPNTPEEDKRVIMCLMFFWELKKFVREKNGPIPGEPNEVSVKIFTQHPKAEKKLLTRVLIQQLVHGKPARIYNKTTPKSNINDNSVFKYIQAADPNFRPVRERLTTKAERELAELVDPLAGKIPATLLALVSESLELYFTGAAGNERPTQKRARVAAAAAAASAASSPVTSRGTLSPVPTSSARRPASKKAVAPSPSYVAEQIKPRTTSRPSGGPRKAASRGAGSLDVFLTPGSEALAVEFTQSGENALVKMALSADAVVFRIIRKLEAKYQALLVAQGRLGPKDSLPYAGELVCPAAISQSATGRTPNPTIPIPSDVAGSVWNKSTLLNIGEIYSLLGAPPHFVLQYRFVPAPNAPKNGFPLSPPPAAATLSAVPLAGDSASKKAKGVPTKAGKPPRAPRARARKAASGGEPVNESFKTPGSTLPAGGPLPASISQFLKPEMSTDGFADAMFGGPDYMSGPPGTGSEPWASSLRGPAGGPGVSLAAALDPSPRSSESTGSLGGFLNNHFGAFFSERDPTMAMFSSSDPLPTAPAPAKRSHVYVEEEVESGVLPDPASLRGSISTVNGSEPKRARIR